MKKKKRIKMEVAPDEEELLHTIRNWVRSNPNVILKYFGTHKSYSTKWLTCQKMN